MIDKQKMTRLTRAEERLWTMQVVCEGRRHNHQFVDDTRWPDAHRPTGGSSSGAFANYHFTTFASRHDEYCGSPFDWLLMVHVVNSGRRRPTDVRN